MRPEADLVRSFHRALRLRSTLPMPPLAVVALAALAPATLHAALAGTAAILFEAAPFVLASAALERMLSRYAKRLPPGAAQRAFALARAAIGCGCGGRLRGTLSIPAFGLCWLAFGPLIAGARLVLGGIVAAFLLRDFEHERAHKSDALDELHDLLPSAALASLVPGMLVADPAIAHAPPVALALGLLAGLLTPCAPGAVALAAAVRGTFPLMAAGLLLTADLPLPSRRANAAPDARSRPETRGYAFVALAFACAWLTVRGGAGFVHPRLVPLVGAAAVLALIATVTNRRATAPARRAGAVPALLLVALVLGSPVPSFTANETTLEGAFPGERVSFTGAVQRRGPQTTLVRYAITCCRADAFPVALRLEGALDVPSGAWLAVRGVLRRTPDGLVLHPAETRTVKPPADPFVYR